MSDALLKNATCSAVLDPAHLGNIEGALGTIYQTDVTQRRTWRERLRTLAVIAGPGLIVMVGDNDAGAFSTYSQAGQNYGTALMWILVLLAPVLYVNQEMVLRLGAVTGVGHARLILERFGKFWGAFSVIDLFLLNGLTIVTEFIGINLALGYLGVPRLWGILVAAGVIIGAASTGSFRRFERFSLGLCFFSLLLVPVFLMAHPPLTGIARDLVLPGFPADAKLSDVMLLVIAIVGTTVAPWQLFFQQSYVIDKRITPRYMVYGKIDLLIGIAVVLAGAVAMMATTAASSPIRLRSRLAWKRMLAAPLGSCSRSLCSMRALSAPPPSRCRPPMRSATCSLCATRCTGKQLTPEDSTRLMPR
jgi:Mn2+/Fe2+ NRAMP family transporter